MNYTFTQIDLIYLLLLGFCVHMSYMLGRRIGISDTLNHLESKGLIELDDDWKIVLDKMVVIWYNNSIKMKLLL
jgi:CRP-like cAMP-binding protein